MMSGLLYFEFQRVRVSKFGSAFVPADVLIAPQHIEVLA